MNNAGQQKIPVCKVREVFACQLIGSVQQQIQMSTRIWADRIGWKDFDTQDYQKLKKDLRNNPSPHFQEEFWPWFTNVLTSTPNLRIGIVGGEPLSNPMFESTINALCNKIDPSRAATSSRVVERWPTNIEPSSTSLDRHESQRHSLSLEEVPLKPRAPYKVLHAGSNR